MNRALATDFVSEVNAATTCNRCGSQPIEWHREYHEEHPNARVSSLRAQGCSIKRIQKQMDLSEPLCRRCHMTVDGRVAALHTVKPRQKGSLLVGKRPCACCGKPAKPMRNGKCATCDNHHSGRKLRKTASCDGCCR